MAWILLCILLVSLFQISTNGAEVAVARSVREGDRHVNQKPNGGFIFPGLTSRSGDELTPIIPDECKKIGICEDVPNYPEDLVSSILYELGRQNRTKFNRDVLDIPQIAERVGPDEETIELCNSVERLIAPQAAQDANKQWRIIVNDKVKPQQTFRAEICQTKESPCSSLAYFPNGYQARCVQKYILRQMVSINEHKEYVELPFQVPSCCSCIVKKDL